MSEIIPVNKPVIIAFYTSKKKSRDDKYTSWIYCRNDHWCAVYTDEKRERLIHGVSDTQDEYATTLYAISELLKWITPSDNRIRSITVYVQNPLVSNCVNEWIPKWMSNNFKTDEEDRPYSNYMIELIENKKDTHILVKTLFAKAQHITDISDIHKYLEF